MPSDPPIPHPIYEGRPLARPEDEVTDQGLSFDVVTLLSRRRMLRALGLGAAAVGLGLHQRPNVRPGRLPDLGGHLSLGIV